MPQCKGVGCFPEPVLMTITLEINFMLTIGEFSKLGRVSSRMLRHYDTLGLLCPAHIGAENGYRYYDQTQLAVLLQIERLKRYGFSLADIKELLTLSQDDLAQRIHARRLQAYKELNELRQTLRRMENDIVEMEGTSMSLGKYNVIIMENPAQKVFGIKRTINIGEINQLFQDLHAEAAKRGLKRSGVMQTLYFDEDCSFDNMNVEAQLEVLGDGEGVHEEPAGTFIAVTHTGPYETIRYAYEALTAWMAEHPEYKISGPAVERYLKDQGMVSSPEEYETGVLFRVTKK